MSTNTITQQSPTASTVEALAEKRDIPVEWIIANCKREKDGWMLGAKEEGGQLYPDVPTKDENGKVRKYLCFKGIKPDLFVPAVPNTVNFEKHYGGEIPDRVTITEGIFKAIKAASVGIFTVSVNGVWNGLVKGDDGKRILAPTLQGMVTEGCKKFTIAFDADCATKDDVRKASIELGKALEKVGCDVLIATGQWTVDEGKGMDDFISKNGVEEMRARLERALSLSDYIGQSRENKGKGGKRKQLIETITKYFDGTLKYNEMSSRCELNGGIYNNELLHMELAAKEIIEAPKEECLDASLYVAKQNSYHPFLEYLNSLKGKKESKNNNSISGGNVTTLKNDISSTINALDSHWDAIFGLLSPLEKAYLTKTMVGAIARVKNPGCDMQTMLLLVGSQGTRKSTFIKQWAGEIFYSNAYRGTIEKDDILKLHSAMIHEIAEFDKIYGKTDVAVLKDIITTSTDLIRPPYARNTLPVQRRCILTGTSNQFDILKDSTGSRRFWVIRIHQKIDTTRLVEVRDTLWELALELYEMGYSYILDELQEAQREIVNASYQEVNPIRDFVESYCTPDGFEGQRLSEVCPHEIYWDMDKDNEGKEPSKQEMRDIQNALRSLGYESCGDANKKRINGKQRRVWKLLPLSWTNTSSCDSSCDSSPPAHPQTYIQQETSVLQAGKLADLAKTFPENNELSGTVPSTSGSEKIKENVWAKIASSSAQKSQKEVPVSIPAQAGTDLALSCNKLEEKCGSEEVMPKVGDSVRVTTDNSNIFNKGEIVKVIYVDEVSTIKAECDRKTVAGKTETKRGFLGSHLYELISP